MTTEDNCARVSSSDASNSSSNKLRRKRKWDQPAESLISAGLAVPGVFPLGNVGSLVGMALPGVAPVSGTFQQGLMPPSLQQHAAAMVQKITQTKIQEELIAREIVINDAESSIRYMLTKRQTQEEIQKCTGSVVITRGKYRPPNGPPDGEKPLYLHISAGAHLETTADRIKAVDRAADMVEQMLKQGSLANGPKPLSTCVFLGFEADPSLNIVARIRGPNDQYVNHIMNETGATVLLRGRGSENSESSLGEEELQPLHLFLSSNNPKSFEHAKLLAENLVDTICAECGASRVSSCKVYGAVPPPHQLLTVPPTTTLTVGSAPVAAVPSATVPLVTTFPSQGTIPNIGGYSQPTVTGLGTNYNGYCGIYPQATPLQQVALALRQSVSSVTSTVSPVAATRSTASFSSTSSSEREKRRRKFQELPVTSKVPAVLDQNLLQDSEFSKPQLPKLNMGERNISNMPSLKKLRQQSVDGFTPPPPRNMPPPPPPRSMPLRPPPPRSMPPPPPPKFNSSPPVLNVPKDSHVRSEVKAEVVPDTLIQLMEYGDDDDDEDEETSGRPLKSDSNLQVSPKPFWAL